MRDGKLLHEPLVEAVRAHRSRRNRLVVRVLLIGVLLLASVWTYPSRVPVGEKRVDGRGAEAEAVS